VFSLNTAASLGKDVVYNSRTEVYTIDKTQGSCSSSSQPHISGSSTTYT
jgi:hypothetical protein